MPTTKRIAEKTTQTTSPTTQKIIKSKQKLEVVATVDDEDNLPRLVSSVDK